MATKKKVTKKATAKKSTSKKTAKKKTSKKVAKKSTGKKTVTKEKGTTPSRKKAKTKRQIKPTPDQVSEKASTGNSSRKQNKAVEKQPVKKYQRRKIKHIWPPIGCVIHGRLKGVTFKAEIVDDPDITKEHGKAIKSLDEPKLPLAYTVQSSAMLFTKKLREANDMKPIANGWKWWRVADGPHAGKRLFDIEEYSQVIED